MKHLSNITIVAPKTAETLLEWTQKGVIFNSFANAFSTVTEIKLSLED